MKREIKFRVWDKVENKMGVVTCLNFFDECIEADELPSGEYRGLPMDSTPIMQYTGLKDKNGKEIYEMDILKDEFGELVYVEKLNPVDDCFTPNQTKQSIGMLEIIGNSYENKELLK